MVFIPPKKLDTLKNDFVAAIANEDVLVIKISPPLEDAMPKRIIPFSDAKIKNARPKEKDYKLADGGGLYLLSTQAMDILKEL
ncbi:MAG: hypothetical protein K9K75_02055 [Deltaproteobacteria bacterium]|nr:hypothetical protein [Deltaproteobacteria bacterium]